MVTMPADRYFLFYNMLIFPSFALLIMYRYFAPLLLLVVLPGITVYAQSSGATIHIVRGGGIPVPGAKVTLERKRDAFKLPVGTADSSGIVRFDLVRGEMYFLDIAARGFIAYTGLLQPDSAEQTFTYTLVAGQKLKEAVITSSRPMMRQEDDKTIVDPEALANSATSAYEVLERTPGVIADQDGNFFMTSATPASIYINGREMKMSNTDIAAMLKSLPPHAIAKIEIMRTPSARYDASGSGGILNIVLKKGFKIGLTGSVNAGIQQGVYSNQFAGVSLNYSDGDKSAYLNLNYAHRKSMERILADRKLTPDSLLAQDAGTIYDANNIFLGYGGSKTIDSVWDISYDGRISTSFSNNHTESRSVMNRLSSGALLSDNIAATGNGARTTNIDQSIDAKYKIDSLGSEWTSNLSWNGNFAHNTQDIGFTSVLPAISDVANNGTFKTSRNYLAFQTDLKYKYKWQLTFETGLKSSATFFRNNSDYTITYQGTSVPDPVRSATYRYNENINAAYFQVSKAIKDIIIKPGIRVENTNMEGHQTRPGKSDFIIRRTDLFPYLYISKKLMTIAHYDLRAYLVYRRTVLRPTYDYLNPFQRFIDPYLYETGNPSLRPQFTHNYEANISIDERPLLAIGHNDISDIFSNVVYQSDSDASVAYRTYDNLGRNKETYIRGFGGIPPGGKYFFILGGQYNFSNYDGMYNGVPLQYKRESWTFFTYHTLKITKTTNLVVNGFMRLNGLMQFYELGTFGSLNASLSQSFMDKKLLVTLSVQDMFFSNRYNYSINQGPMDATGSRYSDSRRFGINIRYNFGIRKKEEHDNFFNMGGGERRNEE